MKKKNILLVFAIMLITSLSVMAMQWSKVSDSCGKCKINDTERKCGECGGYMNSGKDQYVPGGWLKSTYTCKECSHSCVYKCKN